MKKNKIIKCVAVLCGITVACVAILAVVNQFWRLSDEEKFNKAVSSVIKAKSFSVIYNYDDPSEEHKTTAAYADILKFNEENGDTNKLVNKVRLAVGGEDDGCYLIESTGKGYRSAYVKMLVGIDENGAILGVMVMDMDPTNNLAGGIDWDKLSVELKGKTGNVGVGSDLAAITGATPVLTLNGAAEAINLATKFFDEVLSASTRAAVNQVAANPMTANTAAVNQLSANQGVWPVLGMCSLIATSHAAGGLN